MDDIAPASKRGCSWLLKSYIASQNVRIQEYQLQQQKPKDVDVEARGQVKGQRLVDVETRGH